MSSTGNIAEKIRWLENIYRQGKISDESYQNTLRVLEEEIVSLEKKEIEENIRGILKKNPSADVVDGRLYIKLKCPKCKTVGSNTKEQNEFYYLGKDGKGHLFFKCPTCRKHLRYETLTGNIERRRFLIGFFHVRLKKIFH